MMAAESGAFRLASLTVTAGRDKDGRPEAGNAAGSATGYDAATGAANGSTARAGGITLVPGQITALLGPTGSGKSRFLSDIESLAAGDTPSGRRILLNGAPPTPDERFELTGRLVAQLTQNMNFVLDMGVADFLLAHAESRGVADPQAAARQVLAMANSLAGEPFAPTAQLTQLSGGQSRALMIADTALLSWSPVLLIDEIENAGIDKGRAMELLVKSDKIIVMATHDPVLALSAGRRLVFENGAVRKSLTRTPDEAGVLRRLSELEAVFSLARARLRSGEPLG